MTDNAKANATAQILPTAAVYTLGCKVSQYESRAIEEQLIDHGIRICPFDSVCSVYIINTCTVTAESDRKCRQIIRRAIQKNPQACIIVTGCYAQNQPKAVAAIPGVNYVFGSRDKMKAAAAAIAFINGRAADSFLMPEAAKAASAVTEPCASRKSVTSPEVSSDGCLCDEGVPQTHPVISVSSVAHHQFEQLSARSSERTRAYLKIEDGCENRCTYCAIPAARGLVASRTPEDVFHQVRVLVANGYREIVLTGIEVASYGRDGLDTQLIDLLEQVDRIEGVERIRLGSLEPTYLRGDVAERMAGLRHLMPGFHLSMQSGSASVLAQMHRKYNPEMALDIIDHLRRLIPDVMFTTDMMTGFPGETEENAAETLDFIRQARFLHIHVFPFSKRKGTPAWEMPDQIPKAVREERAAVLQRQAADIREALLMEEIHQRRVYPVLFEQYEDGLFSGHTPNFMEVFVRDGELAHGEICSVRLTGLEHGRLIGEKTNEV